MGGLIAESYALLAFILVMMISVCYDAFYVSFDVVARWVFPSTAEGILGHREKIPMGDGHPIGEELCFELPIKSPVLLFCLLPFLVAFL